MSKLVFFGTPAAAVPTLRRLAEEHDVALVVTQPDRPRGRSRKPKPPPVKEVALELGIDVAQPESAAEMLEAVGTVKAADLGVVVAYGRILRPALLDSTQHGFLNVHFSLLPRWRGAAPVARAIMAGDPMSGVSIIKLDEGLDTGPVLTAQAVDVLEEETHGALSARLAELGARLLAASIPGFLEGTIEPVPQSDEGVTYAEKITAEDRRLSTRLRVSEAHNLVRGLAPVPGATIDIDGVSVKVLAAGRSESSPKSGSWEDVGGLPVVGFDGGGLELRMVQPEGKRVMGGDDWLRGLRRDRGTAR